RFCPRLRALPDNRPPNERKAAMDWERAIEEEQAALKRIAALLFALAGLAERACSRSQAVRGFVLWLLLPAEAVARNLVVGTLTPIPLRRACDSPADAMRLARNFRDLAQALDRQAALAFAVYDDDHGQKEPAWFRQMLRIGCLNFIDALAFLTSARDILRVA